MWVVDASVYVASLSGTDRHHARAWSWFETAAGRGDRLLAPNLLAVELAASIRRLADDETLARRAVSELLADQLVELAPLTAERGLRASEVAVRAGVRGADAVYLALAEELGAVLVTLDRQLLKRGGLVARVQRP